MTIYVYASASVSFLSLFFFFLSLSVFFFFLFSFSFFSLGLAQLFSSYHGKHTDIPVCDALPSFYSLTGSPLFHVSFFPFLFSRSLFLTSVLSLSFLYFTFVSLHLSCFFITAITDDTLAARLSGSFLRWQLISFSSSPHPSCLEVFLFLSFFFSLALCIALASVTLLLYILLHHRG